MEKLLSQFLEESLVMFAKFQQNKTRGVFGEIPEQFSERNPGKVNLEILGWIFAYISRGILDKGFEGILVGINLDDLPKEVF